MLADLSFPSRVVAVPALREQHTRFGNRIYGRYGFADAFHPPSGPDSHPRRHEPASRRMGILDGSEPTGSHLCYLSPTMLVDAAASTPADRSPWLMWFSPRRTVRRLLDSDPQRSWVPVTVLAGVNQALIWLGDHYDALNADPASTVFHATWRIGFLVFGVFIGSFILAFVGGWLDGQGDADDVRQGIAWSYVPLASTTILWVPQLLVYRNEASPEQRICNCPAMADDPAGVGDWRSVYLVCPACDRGVGPIVADLDSAFDRRNDYYCTSRLGARTSLSLRSCGTRTGSVEPPPARLAGIKPQPVLPAALGAPVGQPYFRR